MKIKLFILFLMMSAMITYAEQPVRVALFNIWELSTEKLTDMENGVGQHEQVLAAAKIIQTVRPDILVINEIDHDYRHPKDLAKNARRFVEAYLNQGENPIHYAHVFAAPCNTGILTGLDLNHDGLVADSSHIGTREYGNDCFGYGEYPGQFSMAVLSKFPVDSVNVRTFQTFLWQDLPENHLPQEYYSQEAKEMFRLSSKSHWDVPITVGEDQVHLFVSHPTPPVFDGEEDRNGRRNFDEIKFWVDYINNNSSLYDDDGVSGGFGKQEPFIIAGDLNASPYDEATYDNITAAGQLLQHPHIQDTLPFTVSEGAVDENQPEPVAEQKTYTAQFGSGRRTRIDYVLPSQQLKIVDGGVFWPDSESDPHGHKLAEQASDHRLVWIDVELD